MSLVMQLHQARKERRARFAAAARRVTSPVDVARWEGLPIVALPRRSDERLPATEQSADLILKAVSKMTRVSTQDLMSYRRSDGITAARQIAMWVLLVGVEQCRIEWAGKMMKRHHKCLLHGWRAIESDLGRHKQTIQRISHELGVPLLEWKRQRTLTKRPNPVPELSED